VINYDIETTDSSYF